MDDKKRGFQVVINAPVITMMTTIPWAVLRVSVCSASIGDGNCGDIMDMDIAHSDAILLISMITLSFLPAPWGLKYLVLNCQPPIKTSLSSQIPCRIFLKRPPI